MTKVSVFGQETEKKKGKPIEFVKAILRNGEMGIPNYGPYSFDNVMLYSKSKNREFDMILAFDNDEENGKKSIYLGHWNDGFVE